MIRRLLISSYRRVYTQVSARASPPRNRNEFSRVNTCAGIEPVRPALSGLEVRKPVAVPRRTMCLLIHVAYRWQPSPDYRCRQLEMHELNKSLKCRPRLSSYLPPILLYVEDDDLLPTRLQPPLDLAQQNGIWSIVRCSTGPGSRGTPMLPSWEQHRR